MALALTFLALVQTILLVFFAVHIRRSSRMAEKAREVAARATERFMGATQRLGFESRERSESSTSAG